MSTKNQQGALSSDALDSLLGGGAAATSATTVDGLKPLTLVPVGMDELMDDFGEGGTKGGLEIPAQAGTAMPPDGRSESMLVRALSATITNGDGQKGVVGQELSEPFMLEVLRGDSSTAYGEPVILRVTYGSGEFTFADGSVQSDGSITALFKPQSVGPWSVECVIGTDKQLSIVLSGEALAAEVEASADNESTDEAPDGDETEDETSASLDDEIDDEEEEDEPVAAPVVVAPVKPASVKPVAVKPTNVPVVAPRKPVSVKPVTAAAPPGVVVDTAAVLAAEEAAITATLKRISEPSTTAPKPAAASPVTKVATAPIAVPGTPISDSAIDRMIAHPDATDAVDDRKVPPVPDAPIPTEERGTTAKLRRNTRDVSRFVSSLSGKGLLVGGIMLVVVISAVLFVDRKPTNDAPEAQAQTAQSVGVVTKKTLVFNCPTAARTAHATDDRLNTVRCTIQE